MLEMINAFVWGYPVLYLLLGTGIFLSVRLGFPQIRFFFPACRQFALQFRSGNSSSFRSLCTALAAAAGTGNIAGVAGAIAIGGPGAVFWMWVSAWIGMATKYAEALLAVHYQRDGIGGAMWIIERGLGNRFRPLAAAYSLFGLAACFGVGNAAQINAVMDAVQFTAANHWNGSMYGFSFVILLVFAVLVWWSLRSGDDRIVGAAELLVPAASALYLILCFAVLLPRIDMIPQMLRQIITGAFTPSAVTGGAVGSAVAAIRVGVSRGTFSNEAGMGTSAAAHAGASVQHPAQQGMMGIMEVFIDTIIICTLTAFVILISGIPVPYGSECGAALTAQALNACCGNWAGAALTLCLSFFAFATILGWGLYAGRFLEYLTGRPYWNLLALCHAAVVIIGGVMNMAEVWQFSELMNAMMAIPNLLTLLLLSNQVRCVTNAYAAEK